MNRDPVADFKSSMILDYEKWPDGLGYDIDLIDQMTPEQKLEIEQHLRQNGISDWRDLEALDRLGTPTAVELILEARASDLQPLALRAQEYGPSPTTNDREASILRGLSDAESMLDVIDDAADHPSPKVIAKLFECARTSTGTEAYQAALALYYIHGNVDSMHSWDHRPFLLRFVDPGPDKAAALEELRENIGLGVQEGV
jgi:hypothetical protein